MDTPDRDFERCRVCGGAVDMTDPRQIAHHMTAGHEAVVPGTEDRVGLLRPGDPSDEAANFATCAACCQTYDIRDNAELAHHAEPGHKPLLPVV